MDDQHLVNRIKRGDHEAFAELVNTHQKLIYHIGLRLLNDPQEAADMAQETFLRAYKSSHRFRGDAKVRSWLGRIAYNLCLDQMKKANRHQNFLQQHQYQHQYQQSSATPEDHYLQTEQSTRLNQAVKSLPAELRVVLILFHAHDMSYQDIAEVIKKPMTTVKTRIYRARQLLRQTMEEGKR